jgi:diguanylate cyclase (GGDEF)-like protein
VINRHVVRLGRAATAPAPHRVVVAPRSRPTGGDSERLRTGNRRRLGRQRNDLLRAPSIHPVTVASPCAIDGPFKIAATAADTDDVAKVVSLRAMASSAVALSLSIAPMAAAVVTPRDPKLDLVDRAIETVLEERSLVPLGGPSAAPEDRLLLAEVDGQGAAILAQFDVLDIELAADTRVVLDRLPVLGTGVPVPTTAQYDSALDNLTDLRDSYRSRETQRPEGLSQGVRAAVVVVALVALGLLLGWKRRRHDQHLINIAFRDSLTGLANRRRLDDDLASMRTTAIERSVIAMMIDVDHFKSFNDRFGHATGDKVLRNVAETIAAEVRSTDVAYRYGGEEFCVLLPGASVDEAQVVAERIRDAVAGLRVDAGASLSVSIGVAAGPQRHASTVLRAADTALFDAKRAGRNTVMTSRQLTPSG